MTEPDETLAVLELRMAATHVGVDPDDAVAAARMLTSGRAGDAESSAADALVEQLMAGVDLDAAVSALRDARPS